MAKSLAMSGQMDEAITPEGPEEGTGELHRLDLPEGIDPFDAADPTTSLSSPTDPIPGADPQEFTQEMQFSAEEREAIVEAFDSISDKSDAILHEAATALFNPAAERDPATVFENTDITPREMEHALNEVMERAGIEMEAPRGDTGDPVVLNLVHNTATGGSSAVTDTLIRISSKPPIWLRRTYFAFRSSHTSTTASSISSAKDTEPQQTC